MKKKILACVMSAFMLATGAVGVMAAEQVEETSVQTRVTTHHLSNLSVSGGVTWNRAFDMPSNHNNLRAFYSNLTSSSARVTITREAGGSSTQVMSFTVSANSNDLDTIANARNGRHLVAMTSVGGSQNLNGILSVASSTEAFPSVTRASADFETAFPRDEFPELFE